MAQTERVGARAAARVGSEARLWEGLLVKAPRIGKIATPKREEKQSKTLMDMAQHVYKVGVDTANEGKYNDAIGYLENLNMALPLFTASMLQTGRCHWEMHRWELARKYFETAVRLEPENDDAGWTVGLLSLQMGDFKAGWQGYERRWGSKTFNSPRLHTKRPMWERGKHKRPIVWCEQGIGDQILYGSLIEALARECEHVTVLIDLRLVGLFERGCKAPNVTFLSHSSRIKMKEHDSHLPIASLGRLFIKRVWDIPFHVSEGYLASDPYRVKELRKDLGFSDEQFVVGISWHSNAPSIGQHKSVPLEQFKPILDTPYLKFINLQYGEAQKEGIDFHPNLITTHIDTFLDMENVAALIDLCDVIISPSCATVHLAGAMGKDVLLLDANKLWYWNSRLGNESMWYSGVKIYQRENMNAPWDLQLKHVKEELDLRLDFNGRRVRDNFVFMYVGDDISGPQKMVKSILRHNPDANIIMCTDQTTPDVLGVTDRREFDLDRAELMTSRLKCFAELKFAEPALYIDTDMIFIGRVEVDKLLGENEIAMCRRDFQKDVQFNPYQRGIDFAEYAEMTIDDVYPFVACATATRNGDPWIEMYAMLNDMDKKFRKWYGDQEALREYAKKHKCGEMPESIVGCLPEFNHDGAKILHYKGEARKQQFEVV